MLGPIARGQTDETRMLIARALMSDDPVAALAPALRQEMTTAKGRSVIAALLRQPMREGGEALGQ
jgi:ABC-type thiamine transport system ATPase subunit